MKTERKAERDRQSKRRPAIKTHRNRKRKNERHGESERYREREREPETRREIYREREAKTNMIRTEIERKSETREGCSRSPRL